MDIQVSDLSPPLGYTALRRCLFTSLPKRSVTSKVKVRNFTVKRFCTFFTRLCYALRLFVMRELFSTAITQRDAYA
eukprot:176218-Prorocentrum_minimum.AAC.1